MRKLFNRQTNSPYDILCQMLNQLGQRWDDKEPPPVRGHPASRDSLIYYLRAEVNPLEFEWALYWATLGRESEHSYFSAKPYNYDFNSGFVWSYTISELTFSAMYEGRVFPNQRLAGGGYEWQVNAPNVLVRLRKHQEVFDESDDDDEPDDDF